MLWKEIVDADQLVQHRIDEVMDIDLVAREEAIYRTVGTGPTFRKTVASLLRTVDPIKVPPDLYGFVPLKVLIAEGVVETHMADEILVENCTYIPDLLGVNIVELDDSQLISYQTYCGSFSTYLDSLAQDATSLKEITTTWAKRLYNLLQETYYGNQNVSRRRAKVDPAVVYLEDLAYQATREKADYDNQISSLKRRERVVSQELDRRKQAYFREVRTGFGSGSPHRGPRVQYNR